MPVLNSWLASRRPAPAQSAAETAVPEWARSRRDRIFPACANPGCAGGWMRLWRKRRVPVVEGGWLCSPACTRARVRELIAREQAGAHPAPPHHHRVPIGLILLTRGWITRKDLKQALAAQHAGSKLRLGEWLVRHRGLSEEHLTRALGAQWGCPVFLSRDHAATPPVTAVPRLLAESFGFVPLRLTAAGELYLAFEDRIDHSFALAVERMTGLTVISGLLGASQFAEVRRRMAEERFARTRLIEAGSSDLLADAFARHIEGEKPVESRLVRMRDLFWLRLWREASEDAGSDPAVDSAIEDVIGAVTDFHS